MNEECVTVVYYHQCDLLQGRLQECSYSWPVNESYMNRETLHLGYELESRIGEERADSQTNEVCEDFGEVWFLSEGNESQTQQWSQVNNCNSQKAISPYCM